MRADGDRNRAAEMENSFKIRIWVLSALALLGLGLLTAMLALEQIHFSAARSEKIRRQSVRRIRIPARRGKIFTSDLKVLADNHPGCNLVLYAGEMFQRGRRENTVNHIYSVIERLARATGRENTVSHEDIALHLTRRPGLPLVIFEGLSPREIGLALEAGRGMNGVDIQPDESRTYPAGRMAAHLIGYTRVDTAQEAADRDEFSYYIPDRVGVIGVERAFDSLPADGRSDLANELGLRGEPGYSLVQVDVAGIVRNELIKRIEPRHGNNVIMTIDSRAQAAAERLLRGRRGAIVLLDADNGDVLAAASAPDYDMSLGFSRKISQEYFNALRNDPDRPLYNRAFMGSYTPGSIIKLLSSLGFLNAGVDPLREVECRGVSRIGDGSIRCASWRSGGHGRVDLVRAIAKSCNDYMIQTALQTGKEPIVEVMRSAGIGRKSGVELAESAGVFPSEQEKMRRYGTRWNSYDTALLSIGQGIITLSPLQAALYTAAIANGGALYRPHVVAKVVDSHGNPVFERVVEHRGMLDTTPEALEIVRRGMFEVVNSPDGSGRAGALDELEIYGKTGSAEIGPAHQRRLTTWFVCFVHHEGRTYACSVMVEEGSSGGRSCAPLAAELFRQWLCGEP